MTTITARRIVHFVDDMGMSYERLASQLDCTTDEARATYATARGIVFKAEVRGTIAKLNELAATFGTTASDLLAMYA